MTTTQKSVVDMYLEGKSFDVRCSDTLYPMSNGSAPSEGDDGYLRVLDNGLSCPWPHTIYYVHHTSWQTLGRGTEEIYTQCTGPVPLLGKKPRGTACIRLKLINEECTNLPKYTHTCFYHRLSQHMGSEGGHLTGFTHNSTACSNGRRYLEGEKV